MFIEHNGEVTSGFLVVFFFVFDFLGDLPKGLWRLHFPGDFLAGKLAEIFAFCAVVVTIFCILSVYLFIITINLVDVN